IAMSQHVADTAEHTPGQRPSCVASFGLQRSLRADQLGEKSLRTAFPDAAGEEITPAGPLRRNAVGHLNSRAVDNRPTRTALMQPYTELCFLTAEGLEPDAAELLPKTVDGGQGPTTKRHVRPDEVPDLDQPLGHPAV